jgi:hypothetical protein
VVPRPAGAFPGVPLWPPYPRGTREYPAPDPGRPETVSAGAGGGATWRFLRGGAFSYAPEKARSAYRDWIGSFESREFLGFRVVRTLPRGGTASPRPDDPSRPGPAVGSEKTVDRAVAR